jgi:ppGpp synthetase/RelA/SpoT-type nucleotidyltranferase
MQIVTHIVFDKRKSLVPEQMGDILNPSGEEVVHADHGMSRLQQQIGKMTPEKPGSACNKDMHTMTLLLRYFLRECHEIFQNRCNYSGR